MPTFDELKKSSDSPSQVRKALSGVAFLAPMTAPHVSTLTDAQGAIQTLPAGYKPVGLVSKDGYTFSGSTDTAEVEALGYSSPVREDIVSRTSEVTFTAYEVFRRELLELAYGLDLSKAEQGANGEIVFDMPAMPANREFRLIIIARDGSGATETYRAKYLPRVKMTEVPDETWNSDDAMAFEVTLKALVDDELGTGERNFLAGPGVKADTELGFNKTS